MVDSFGTNKDNQHVFLFICSLFIFLGDNFRRVNLSRKFVLNYNTTGFLF